MPERLYGICAARHQIKVDCYVDSGYYMGNSLYDDDPWHWHITYMKMFYPYGSMVSSPPPEVHTRETWVETMGSSASKFEALRTAIDRHKEFCPHPMGFLTRVRRPYGSRDEPEDEVALVAPEADLPLPYDQENRSA